MKKKLFSFWAVFTLTAFFTIITAQEISGLVLSESGKPISDVRIFNVEKKISTTANSGIFILPKNTKLPLILKFLKDDYLIQNKNITKNKDTIYLILKQIDSIKTKKETLKEVVISAAKENSETKLIIPPTKINSEKFEILSPIDLVAAINETPGIYIQSGAINTNRIVIRGVGSRTPYGSNKTKAYFNGIPITNGAGETAIDIYDPENLQSLEIVKGPKATLFGTNLGGTILLNSKEVEPGNTIFRSNLTFGSFGLLKNTVSIATANNKFSINIAYDHLATDGFRQNSNFKRKSFLVNSSYKINANNQVDLLLHYVDYFAEIPSSIGKTAFDEDPTQAAFTWLKAQGFEANKQTLVGISLSHNFSENFTNKTSIFYTYLDHYEPRPFNILDEYTNGFGARSVFNKEFKFLNKNANLSFGAELYNDSYNWKTIENNYEQNNGNGSLEGELLSNNKEIRNNLNVFTQLSLPLTEKLIAQIGLNFNKTTYDFTDKFNQGGNNKNANRSFEPIFAPSLNVLYQFNPDFKSHINMSRGFNFPSIEETLTPEGSINPELGPEKGFNYEVGSELFLFRRNLHVNVAAYILSIDDLLIAERVGDDQYIGRNAGKTNHKGIEISANYKFIITENFHLSPYLNFEFNNHKFVDFIDEDEDFSGNQLTGVPDKKINGGINIGFHNFILNSNFLHIGKIPLNDENSLFTESYDVVNAKISYKKSISKNIFFELNFGVNNLGDEKYASSFLINAVGFGGSEPRYYYPAIPRNYYGGFKINGNI